MPDFYRGEPGNPADLCRACGVSRSAHVKSADLPGHSQCPGFADWSRDDFRPVASPVARPAEGGHPGYLALLDEMRSLHLKKAADYGRGADPLANCRASVEFGVPAWVGTMIRACDKVHRVKSYLQNGTLANEGVRDSLMDLAAYALIALVLFDEEQDAEKGGAA